MKNISIALLSSWGNPFLSYTLKELKRAHFEDISVICAGSISEKDAKIIKKRVDISFFSKSISDMDISNIPFFFVDSHNSVQCRDLVKKTLRSDILVNAGSPNILKKDILDSPRLGVINCHPGLLPEYRGRTCVEWAIYNNDPIGATCHFMTTEIDRGAIMARARMPVRKEWPYRRIRTEIIFHSLKVLVRGLKKAFGLNKNYKRLPIPGKGTYYPVIGKKKMQKVLKIIKEKKYKWVVR